MNSFFLPYMKFLIGAAYNIQQTLEGLHIWSSSFLVRDTAGHVVDSYWSPIEAMFLPFLGLMILLLGLLVTSSLAGYALASKKGVFVAILLWITPGLLSVLGVLPDFNLVPDTYHIATGYLGSPLGLIPLVFMGLLTGWVIVILLTNILKLEDKYRHYYDHVWYAMAVIAGIFFVVDSQNNDIQGDLKETGSQIRQASSYLLKQAHTYEQYCAQKNISDTESCKWASDVQQKLLDYSVDYTSVYWQTGPMSVEDIYVPIKRDKNLKKIDQIRNELRQFNDLICPKTENRYTRSSGSCLRTPPQFCVGKNINADDLLRTSAIADECVISSLVSLRLKAEALSKKVLVVERNKHIRWFFYILFSILAGGKVANATARANQDLSRNDRLVRLLKSMRVFILIRLYKSLNKIKSNKLRKMFVLLRR